MLLYFAFTRNPPKVFLILYASNGGFECRISGVLFVRIFWRLFTLELKVIISGVLFLCFSFLIAKMLVRVLRRRDGSEFMIDECLKGLFLN